MDGSKLVFHGFRRRTGWLSRNPITRHFRTALEAQQVLPEDSQYERHGRYRDIKDYAEENRIGESMQQRTEQRPNTIQWS